MSNKQEDHDLYQLASIIDAALTSDTPAVKKALRNFLLVASIAEANEDSPKGPIIAPAMIRPIREGILILLKIIGAKNTITNSIRN